MNTRATPPTWILPLTSEQATLPLVGGKGANLARLAQAGFPVPDGFFITVAAYQAFVAFNGLAEPILNLLSAGAPQTPEQFESVSQQIRALFSHGRLPADLAEQILAAYNLLGHGSTPLAVAVRSSATAEDLPEMSFAGQQDTFLNVIGGEGLLPAVNACWSSLWTGRAISYREHNCVPHADVGLAVVVQKMVESQAAGVLFTANPLSGLRTETVIDATVGLGEALVSGQVQPDQYVVDMRTGRITEWTLGAKAISVRSRPGGGTVTVSEAGAPGQALPDEQIRALAALGQRVADLYSAPQDIEWAWDDSTLHLLQSRPITSLFPVPAGLTADPLKVMLSFGAVQGMLDPMTPLGRDVLNRVAAAAAQLFGMRLTGETQTTFFSAGERLWINLTPLVRNTVGRRLVPVITAFIDPGSSDAMDAIWHDPRLQPTRPGISPRAVRQIVRFMAPFAGNVLLNVCSPARRRQLIVDRGEQLLVAMAESADAIRGAPHARLAVLVRLVDSYLGQHLPRTFRLFVSGVAGGMASYNLLRVLTKDLPGFSTDKMLEVTRGLPNRASARAGEANATSRVRSRKACVMATSIIAATPPGGAAEHGGGERRDERDDERHQLLWPVALQAAQHSHRGLLHRLYRKPGASAWRHSRRTCSRNSARFRPRWISPPAATDTAPVSSETTITTASECSERPRAARCRMPSVLGTLRFDVGGK